MGDKTCWPDERCYGQLRPRACSPAQAEPHSRHNPAGHCPIFRWYRRDSRHSVQAFIARYRAVPLEGRLADRPYDWRLNRQ